MSDASNIDTISIGTVETARHRTSYRAAGPKDGPAILFCHGFPELSLSWRHQLKAFAALGFRAIAPDMRGYGGSTVHPRPEDYALAEAVQDMIELADALGIERALWVGHDWGAPVVWSLSSHHPDRCAGVAGLSLPYGALERGLDAILPLVNRDLYPEDEFPAGQWEYMIFTEENAAKTTRVWEADPYRTFKTLFRSADPAGAGKPAFTAFVRRDGGYYGGADAAPDVPRDPAMISEEELQAYAASFRETGFAGADAWYLNHRRNADYAATAHDGGRLSMPVLFLHGRYDYVCDTMNSRLAEPMRALCSDLTEHVVPAAHWMNQEAPRAVNAHLARWIVERVPSLWPDG